MQSTVKLLLLAVLLALPQTAQLNESQADYLVRTSFYDATPYWKQTMVFPRWQDTYEVVFEQEMLA